MLSAHWDRYDCDYCMFLATSIYHVQDHEHGLQQKIIIIIMNLTVNMNINIANDENDDKS